VRNPVDLLTDRSSPTGRTFSPVLPLGAHPEGAVGTSWRVLSDDGCREPRFNLALEEALAGTAGPSPVVRLWRNSRCVVVGRPQVAAAEVDAAACRRLGVPVLRRISGGGAVYQDAGNLNVTLVVARGDSLLAGIPHDRLVPAVYQLALAPLAEALRELGLPAVAREREVAVGDRKVSGVAARLGRRNLLVHATLLVDADLEILERVLDGPGAPADPLWSATRSRRRPVTSLASEGMGGPGRRAVGAAVVRAFAGLERDVAARRGARSRPFRPGRPTVAERAHAARLLARRYSDPRWHLDGRDGREREAEMRGARAP